jgi:CRP/FNR family cyclic AMP-dependent transcriptional regulator
MEGLERIIKEHPFFKDLDPKFVALVVGCAKNVRFEAGEYLFREGEQADQFYLVRHGRVALEMVRAVSLDAVCLRRKLDDDHDLGYEVMQRFVPVLIERLQGTRLQMLDVYGAAKK